MSESYPLKRWRLSKRLSNNKFTTMPALKIDWHIISHEEKAKPVNNYLIGCSTLDDRFANLPNNYDMLYQNYFEYLETRVGDVHINTCLG